MAAFATIEDLTTLYGVTLTADEQTRLTELLSVVSDELRWHAVMVHRDLDQMISEDSSGTLATVAKEVTVSVAFRVFRQSTDDEPMTQVTQSALGYSVSGTYAVPGGGIGNAIMDRDLKRLGLKRQRMGFIEIAPGKPL